MIDRLAMLTPDVIVCNGDTTFGPHVTDAPSVSRRLLMSVHVVQPASVVRTREKGALVGARGRTKQFGNPIKTRLRKQADTEVRILAAMWSVPLAEVVRILTSEALATREKELP